MNPTITVSDTGSLTDTVGKVLDPFSEGTPMLTPTLAFGIVGGGLSAYTLAPKRSKVLWILVGAIGGLIASRHIQGPTRP